MARYLVTGGAGFIGSHLVTGLIERGEQARVLDDLSGGTRENLAHLEVGDFGSGAPVELLVGDVADGPMAKRAAEGCSGIFHEAAQVSVPRSIEEPEESYRINVMGTLRVLEAARAAGIERLVFAASSAAYGNTERLPKEESMTPCPLSPYASGKLAGEELLAVWGRAYGLKTVSLRYFNVFGPRQADDSPYSGVIAIFARALLEGRSVRIYGDGEQTRDFTYIENVVDANFRALEASVEAGSVFNVGSGERISLNALYDHMARLVGSKVKPTHLEPRAGDVRHSQASLEAVKSQLGFEPRVGWRDGLVPTLDWYRERLARGSAPA